MKELKEMKYSFEFMISKKKLIRKVKVRGILMNSVCYIARETSKALGKKS